MLKDEGTAGKWFFVFVSLPQTGMEFKEQEGGAALLLRELKSLPFFGGLFLLLLLLLFCFLETLKNKAP